MPWFDENGLLPGRGAPGRPTGRGAGAFAAGADGVPGVGRDSGALAAGAAGCSGCAGAGVSAGAFGPGLGPGRGPGPGRTAGSAAGSATFSGAAGVAAAAGASASGWGSAFFSAGLGLAAGLAGSALASAAFSGAGAAALSCSPYSFLNFIATGGSTVEEADLTNSPISFSFSRTNLLSTPNSLASSWTRGLATLLLLARAPDSLVGREG